MPRTATSDRPSSAAGPETSGPHPRRRFLVTCGLALLVLALFVAVQAVPSLPSTTRQAVTRLVLLALALGVTVSCGRTARRARRYNRRIWSMFTLAGVCWSVGQALLLVLADRQPSVWAVVAGCFLLALLPITAGLCAIPPERREKAERLRVWLGASIVVASVVLFCRAVFNSWPPRRFPGGAVPELLQLVSCLVFCGLASITWIVLLRAGTKGRMPLFFVTAGLILYSWASVDFFYRSGGGPGLPLDVLDAATAACYLTFILAALSPHAADPRQPPTKGAKGRYIGLHSLVVYVPVVTAAIVVASSPRTPDPVVIVSGSAVLVLFGIRQMLLSVDNSQLRDHLQVRVDDLVRKTSDLRRLGLQNERIVQSVVDGVIGVDAAGVITFANPAAAAMLSYPRADLLGVQEHDIFHGRPAAEAEGPEDCCIVRTAMGTGTASVSASEHFVARDGRVFPVELAVGPIVEDEEITGAVVVFRDVSERRKIEKMKNEFVSVVSHELRTPLTSIRGSLGLLAGGAAGLLSPKADRMVSVALESSERLTRLINDMLDIERIESGTVPVELSDSEPRILVETAVNAVRGLAGHHRIVVDVDRALPLVRADPDRIVQALTNLIGNAIKFSPPLTTITIAAASRGNFVHFSVADQGRGIPADKLGRVFERFEQVDSSDSREKGGSGLGLAISRTIVRRHGGELTVTSTVGAGSTFRFDIPAAGEAGVIVTSSVGGAASRVGGRAPDEPAGPEAVGVPTLPEVTPRRLAR